MCSKDSAKTVETEASSWQWDSRNVYWDVHWRADQRGRSPISRNNSLSSLRAVSSQEQSSSFQTRNLPEEDRTLTQEETREESSLPQAEAQTGQPRQGGGPLERF